MALFDSDSDGEDVQEVYSCARVDAHYYRGYVIYRKRNVSGLKEHSLDELIFKQSFIRVIYRMKIINILIWIEKKPPVM